ncbi:MAG: TrkH family potassium uptake protein [Gammaproteobacteria bacterium]|jgi:trk system potassium uptake protein TrkH
MNALVVLRIVGLLLALFSLTMLPPVAVSWYYADGAGLAFFEAFLFTLLAGLLLYLPLRRHRAELRIRDGFLVVAGFWVVLGFAGAVPLLLVETPAMGFTDAVFEAVSGFTTTGATVLSGLDSLPRSVLWYRQQIQWFGGMGIIVLAVAILPVLGVGGMQLYRAETPGPMKDTKLTPRITETAKALWITYVGLTVVAAVSYRLAGMSWFDAVGHAFTSIGTAGFSTHDASFGHFNSPLLEWLGALFMFLGATSFALHFFAMRRLLPDVHMHLRGGRPRFEWPHRRRVSFGGALNGYLHDPEFRAFMVIQAALIATIAIYLAVLGHHTPGESLTKAVFQAVSIGTTTGFTSTDFSAWPGALPVLLILASFIGGCAGSTAGGMKVLRWLLIFKQGWRELARLLHPSAVITIRLGDRGVPSRVTEAVWGFFSVYVMVFCVLMAIMMFLGLDQVTAFSAVAATLNNLGPGLGDVSATFASVPDGGKWVGVLAMILGRLEIFTLLVLLTPEFWRR